MLFIIIRKYKKDMLLIASLLLLLLNMNIVRNVS